MDSFAAIIKLWPSYEALAADLGIPTGHVRGFFQRNSVPAEYWRRMVAGAERRGIACITLDRLCALYEARDRHRFRQQGGSRAGRIANRRMTDAPADRSAA